MIGVGTVIHNTVSKYGFRYHKGCNCKQLQEELDSLSPDYIESHLETYVDKLQKSIKKWRSSEESIKRRLPIPPRLVIRKFLEYAIAESRASL